MDFNKNIDHVISLYQKEFDAHGVSKEALMWNKGGQEARFRAKFEIGIEDGDSILDVGCGFADMYAYLVHYNFACNYTGIDLCEAFLQVCREKYPRIDVRRLNLLDYSGDEKWDWCFLVGTFVNEHEQV